MAFTRLTILKNVAAFGGFGRRPRKLSVSFNPGDVMRLASVLFAFLLSLLIVAAPAQAKVTATVSISKQTMVVKVDGEVVGVYRVSTGKKGYATPRGTYSAKRLHARYFSRKYNNAPMHYAVFFRGGYAVHSTSHVAALGRPASHGCVRLAPGNAKAFFALVKRKGGARITITG
jgi:lipoprotein-anchoring transpeptidase ErfK/SrfK